MKKLLFIVLTVVIVGCSSDNKTDHDTVREQAKKDAIERLELPAGTEFNDESVEVTRNPEDGDGPDVEYLVKITVKSQDRNGEEVVKVHRMRYQKRTDAEAAKDRFELMSFE